MRKSKSSGRRGGGATAADPLTTDGVSAAAAPGPTAYGGVAKVRADAVSAAIDALDSDAAARALAAGVSATAAHLHQIALRLVASVEHPTLSRADSTTLLKIVTALLHAGASPKRGLWTALRYYRRYDQWRPIQDFLGKLMRALKRATPVTAEGTTAWLRSVLQYTPNERWPTTWDLLQTALRAPSASEQHRIAAFVANNVRTDWRRGSESS
jgi:hypothetical protein